MNRAMDEYLSNLEARDRHEKRFADMIGQFTKVADRATRAESKLRAFETSSPTTGGTASADLVAHLQTELGSARADLSAAQNTIASLTAEKSSMTTRLETREQELASTTSQRDVATKQAALLDRKLKDRNAEVRENRKLVEQVQDEMISLNLEKNLAEQRAEKLERDNQELVDRWMEYKKKEAERINEQSKW